MFENIIPYAPAIVTGLIGLASALLTFWVGSRKVDLSEKTATNSFVTKNIDIMLKNIELQSNQIEKQSKMIAEQSGQIANLTEELSLARTEIRNLRIQNDELLKQIHELEELLRKKP